MIRRAFDHRMPWPGGLDGGTRFELADGAVEQHRAVLREDYLTGPRDPDQGWFKPKPASFVEPDLEDTAEDAPAVFEIHEGPERFRDWPQTTELVVYRIRDDELVPGTSLWMYAIRLDSRYGLWRVATDAEEVRCVFADLKLGLTGAYDPATSPRAFRPGIRRFKRVVFMNPAELEKAKTEDVETSPVLYEARVMRGEAAGPADDFGQYQQNDDGTMRFFAPPREPRFKPEEWDARIGRWREEHGYIG